VDADTLIIDEALSVGDVRFTQKCMRYLREFQQHGTLLFVSHDTSAVVNLCDRAIWLDSGRMVMDGPARDVVERYLAVQHAADRGSLGEKVILTTHPAERGASNTSAPRWDAADARQAVLNGTVARRNLVEIFEFDMAQTGTEFGAGAMRIVDVRLRNELGEPCSLSSGGEIVSVEIEAEALQAVAAPIFGFYIKDRLGQRIFGDNTYISYRDNPRKAKPGDHLVARFRFRMPILPNGDYSVDVAAATGTQESHTQQHWLHDALVFKARESTMRYGLVGIPMHAIEIEQVETTA
jgi:lipopolysaccharide transport system ATP-binding protein